MSKKLMNLLYMFPVEKGAEADDVHLSSFVSHNEKIVFDAEYLPNKDNEKLLKIVINAHFEEDIDYSKPEPLLEVARKVYELSCIYLKEHQAFFETMHDVHGDAIPLEYFKDALPSLEEYERLENGSKVEFNSPSRSSHTTILLTEANGIQKTIIDNHFEVEIDINDINAVKQAVLDMKTTALLIKSFHNDIVAIGQNTFGEVFDYPAFNELIEQKVQEVHDELQERREGNNG